MTNTEKKRLLKEAYSHLERCEQLGNEICCDSWNARIQELNAATEKRTKPTGYKAHRLGATETLRRRQLRELEQEDLPLAWELDEPLSASQRYRIQRGLL